MATTPLTLPTPPFETTLENLSPMQPNYSVLPESTLSDLMNPDSAINDPLNSLPVSGSVPGINVVPNSSATSSSRYYPSFLKSAASALNTGLNNAKQNYAILKSLASLSLEDYVIIVLGILLLAGAIFSFSSVRDTVVGAVRTAAEVSA